MAISTRVDNFLVPLYLDNLPSGKYLGNTNLRCKASRDKSANTPINNADCIPV